MKNIVILAFGAMCVAQWIVPGKMIYDSERVVRDGRVYKFKTLPIDPSDPFRGKYITLNFEADHLDVDTIADWKSEEEVFVTFMEDSAGFAKVNTLSRSKPDSDHYLRTKVNFATNYEPYQINFNLPFDRFYLEESKASQAEQLYWQAQRDSAQVAYGLVSMGNGTAVITDVMIKDRSVVDIINELNKNK